METQKLRQSLDSVKANMRTKGIKCSVLCPAKLRVVDGETVLFFYLTEKHGGLVRVPASAGLKISRSVQVWLLLSRLLLPVVAG